MTKKYAGGPGGIREHILEMSHMANKLKTMDMPLRESFLVQLVFKSQQKEFATFHVHYNTFPENWNTEKLIAMCVQKEDRKEGPGHQHQGSPLPQTPPTAPKGNAWPTGSAAATTTPTDTATVTG